MLFLISTILLCGLFQLQSCFQLNEATDDQTVELQQNVLKILKTIHLEQKFDTIAIYGSNDKCVFQRVLTHLEFPTILFTQGKCSYEDWTFNTDIILLSCDSKAEQEQNTRNSFKLQQARRLIFLETGVQAEMLCKEYFEREEHNVAMVNEEGILYSCRLFQEPNHVEIDIYSASNSGSIYVQQFQNMHGAGIKCFTNQMPPRTMLSRNTKTGKTEMHGYVGKLINTFVQRVNGTLLLDDDYVFGRIGYFDVIAQKTREGQLDVAAFLAPTLVHDNLDSISYPFVTTSYCLMVPMPKKLPYRQIFTIIVDNSVLGIILILFAVLSILLIYSTKLSWQRLSFVNVLLNDWCLRGLLGQSFPMPYNPSGHLKAICLILFFASLMMTTMYNSYLQSFFTSLPTEKMLHSFEDLRNSPLTYAIDLNELIILLRTQGLTMAEARNAYVMDNYNDYVDMRNSFNASFAYPVTDLRYRTYDEQQKFFEEKAFYYADEMCFNRFVMFCIPLRRNLPYRQHFEQHILYMRSSGLIDFWISRSFYDLVYLNMTIFRDYSVPQILNEPVYLDDLSYIFAFYIFNHLIACICFGIECYWGRSTRRVASVKNV